MKKLILLAVSSILLAVSCKKPNDDAKPGSFGFLNGTVLNGSMPTVENGMLSFKDREHFDRYISGLEVYVNGEFEKQNKDDNAADTNKLSTDEILLAYEQANFSNFVSFRSEAVRTFDILNNVGWDKFEDIVNEHPFIDRLFESSLNKDKSVIIGDSIFMYLNVDAVVGFPKNRMDHYSFMATIPKANQTNASSIGEWVLKNKPGIFTELLILAPSESGRVIGTDPGYTPQADGLIKTREEILQPGCDPLAWKVNVSIINVKKGVYSAKSTIYWGDGDSTVNNNIDLLTKFERDHVYPAMGTYHPYIKYYILLGDYISGVGSIIYGHEEIIVPFSPITITNSLTGYCYKETMKEKNQVATSADGKAKINCRIMGRSSYWANNIQAETEFWKKNSNNKWKKEKTGPYRKTYAKVMSNLSFDECGQWQYKEKSNENTNDKSITAVDRYGKRNPVMFNYIKSYHFAYYGGEQLKLNIELPMCP